MEDAPTTLAGLLEAQADGLGDKLFLYVGDRMLGFADFNRQVNCAANGLAELGVKPGVGVSIMMPNSPEWLFVYFATQKLGTYAVPVNVALKGEGLRHIIDHSDSSVLVCHPETAAVIEEISDSLPGLEEIVVDGREAPEDWAPPQRWRLRSEERRQNQQCAYRNDDSSNLSLRIR